MMTRPECDPDADLTPAGRLILRVLREADGEVTTGTLLRRSGLSRATISRRTDALRDAGLIERRKDPRQLRRYLWSLCE